jgi:hypothetical protein
MEEGNQNLSFLYARDAEERARIDAGREPALNRGVDEKDEKALTETGSAAANLRGIGAFVDEYQTMVYSYRDPNNVMQFYAVQNHHKGHKHFDDSRPHLHIRRVVRVGKYGDKNDKIENTDQELITLDKGNPEEAGQQYVIVHARGRNSVPRGCADHYYYGDQSSTEASNPLQRTVRKELTPVKGYEKSSK